MHRHAFLTTQMTCPLFDRLIETKPQKNERYLTRVQVIDSIQREIVRILETRNYSDSDFTSFGCRDIQSFYDFNEASQRRFEKDCAAALMQFEPRLTDVFVQVGMIDGLRGTAQLLITGYVNGDAIDCVAKMNFRNR